ncbi:MAG: alpha/beta-type small acid-soluble spore protein [Oscillospiraceae bacterium]|nr:alpha/beta-type small acid-soluble spore protein [Oscillospiraceae bacterium]
MSFSPADAQAVGINPKDSCSGDLTSREAGSVGGQMVTIRNTSFVRNSRTLTGHQREVHYIARFVI